MPNQTSPRSAPDFLRPLQGSGDIALSIVIPAYNEQKRIEACIRRIRDYMSGFRHGYEIIVVDDGSADATAEVVEGLKSEIPEIVMISYPDNMGKGHAVRQGMLASKGEFALLSDADLAAPIEELEKLAAAIDEGFDISIGSRALPDSILTHHQPRYRELGGRALNLIVRLLAVPGIMDTQCGFKLFNRKAVQAIFPYCFVSGFAFDVEVLHLARRQGLKIKETPIRWAHQSGSKVRPFSDGVKIAVDALKIRFHRYQLGQG